MTDHDYLSPFVSSRHVGDRASSSALTRVFKTSFKNEEYCYTLSPVYLSCLRVTATGHEQSPLLTAHYWSGVLDMYVFQIKKGKLIKIVLTDSVYV